MQFSKGKLLFTIMPPSQCFTHADPVAPLDAKLEI